MKKAFPLSLGGSDTCYFCKKRVYVMERLSAEGHFFHRECFRCSVCATTLRLAAYAFDCDEGNTGSQDNTGLWPVLDVTVFWGSNPQEEYLPTGSMVSLGMLLRETGRPYCEEQKPLAPTVHQAQWHLLSAEGPHLPHSAPSLSMVPVRPR